MKNGDSINSKAFTRKSKKSIESKEVYGRTRFRPSTNDKQVSSSFGSATQRVKESVKNSSQKKLEFLKKLQEIENISVLPKKSKSTISDDVTNDSEEIDGTVHFTQDEYYKKQDALHQDLELIEQELMKVMVPLSLPFILFTYYTLAYLGEEKEQALYFLLRDIEEDESSTESPFMIFLSYS